MITDIKAHLESREFVSFSIRMNDRRSIRVPSRDHIGVLFTPLPSKMMMGRCEYWPRETFLD
jgi:hypothetical protein